MVLDMDLGAIRRLIGGRNAGKLLNDTLTGLLVQALGVALLGHLDRHIDVDLDKGQTGVLAGGGDLVQTAGGVAVGLVGRDEGGDGDGGAVGEELGDLGDAADVLVAVLLAEAEVFVETEAHVVAVEAVGGDAALAEQLVLEFDGDGRFA